MRRPFVLWPAAGAVCILWSALLIGGRLASDVPAPPSSESAGDPQSLLAPSPPVIDWGVVRPGTSQVKEVILANRGSRPVKLGRVEKTCDCLRVEPSAYEVVPGGSVGLIIRMDLSQDPGTCSNLEMEVRGWSDSGQLAYRVKVVVSVRPS